MYPELLCAAQKTHSFLICCSGSPFHVHTPSHTTFDVSLGTFTGTSRTCCTRQGVTGSFVFYPLRLKSMNQRLQKKISTPLCTLIALHLCYGFFAYIKKEITSDTELWIQMKQNEKLSSARS